jgi:hypothetical protein
LRDSRTQVFSLARSFRRNHATRSPRPQWRVPKPRSKSIRVAAASAANAKHGKPWCTLRTQSRRYSRAKAASLAQQVIQFHIMFDPNRNDSGNRLGWLGLILKGRPNAVRDHRMLFAHRQHSSSVRNAAEVWVNHIVGADNMVCHTISLTLTFAVPAAPACTIWSIARCGPATIPSGCSVSSGCRAPLFIGVPVAGLDDALKFRLHSADSDYVSEQELSHMDASYCYRHAAKRVHGHRTRTAPRRNLARL